MSTTIKQIIGKLFLEKESEGGLYAKMKAMLTTDEEFAGSVVDFACELEKLLDFKNIKEEALNEYNDIPEEEAMEKIKLEVSGYTLALFLLFMEENKLITVNGLEARIAKEVFMSFKKNLD